MHFDQTKLVIFWVQGIFFYRLASVFKRRPTVYRRLHFYFNYKWHELYRITFESQFKFFVSILTFECIDFWIFWNSFTWLNGALNVHTLDPLNQILYKFTNYTFDIFVQRSMYFFFFHRSEQVIISFNYLKLWMTHFAIEWKRQYPQKSSFVHVLLACVNHTCNYGNYQISWESKEINCKLMNVSLYLFLIICTFHPNAQYTRYYKIWKDNAHYIKNETNV